MNELMVLLYVAVICIMIFLVYWFVERRRYEKAREQRRKAHLAKIARNQKLFDDHILDEAERNQRW